MNIERIASVPLIVQDPYISIWSGHDKLYEGDTKHWCGSRQRLNGYISIAGTTYCFLGDSDHYPVMEQQSLAVSATTTTYCFANEWATLSVSFCTPLLLEETLLLSRPCTYLDFQVEMKDKELEATIWFVVSADIIGAEKEAICGGVYQAEDFAYAVFGKARQTPLSHSGDHVTIEWGNCYLAAADESVSFSLSEGQRSMTAEMKLRNEQTKASLVFAYDDLVSINYFGEFRRAYWTTQYGSILEAIGAALQEREALKKRCEELDTQIEEWAGQLAGEEYAYLCVAAYRHAIAAHKLITDTEGNLIFLSKENDSNGCIGTVDISYPSAPLFLLKNAELVKGMLRPVFLFAQSKVWEYDFAPHDVGRYPYATGQVYGLHAAKAQKDYYHEDKSVFPYFFLFPEGTGVYDLASQMPVEESGNMLILTAAISRQEKDAAFALPYMELLKTWADYLKQYGEDPGEQLCTDDFAGHLAHNVNLSVKAIMGIEAFSLICRLLGQTEQAEAYHKDAVRMAESWKKRAAAGDHTKLTFGEEASWSLKYNLVWDTYFGTGLFEEELIQKEIDYYISRSNRYGVPLDSRRSYTKSDWILWCAALCNDAQKRRQLIVPVAHYLKETESRVAFSDWYDTKSGLYESFIARSVQGGIYMPLLLYFRK